MFHTLISTSLKPSDQSRILAKLLSQVIPRSKYMKRGKKNLTDFFEECYKDDIVQILLIKSRGSVADRIEFYDLLNGIYIQNAEYLKILEFMDPKLFNFSHLRFDGPLSTSMETREEDPDLFKLLGEYFKVDFENKRNLWLLHDKRRNFSYIQFTDSKRMKRFAMLKLKVVNRSKKKQE